jgi:glycosyltransferase involved in cell wall biosynthesis
MATYNGAKYIESQLLSVISQLSSTDEVIISDDHSTDGTLSIIQSLHDPRIKIFQGPCKKNPKFNFENALKHAKGDIIFLCDQDDIWEPNKVEVMVSALSDCDLVTSDCHVVDSDLNIISNYYAWLKPANGFLNNLLKTHFLGCCMAFKAKILKETLPFPKTVEMHDMWIGLYAALNYKTKFINDRLIKYRRHGNNVSSSSGPSNRSIFYMIYYRLNMCRLVLVRTMINKLL